MPTRTINHVSGLTHRLLRGSILLSPCSRLVMVLVVAVVSVIGRGALGQAIEEVPITGDSLGGFVLPILPVDSDITLESNTAWTWTAGETQRLLLQGDVRISCGYYFFSSDTAVVWINRLPSAGGLINQMAVWFPKASEPTRRAGLGASGTDLLVTASARGAVTLDCPVIEERAPPGNTGVQAARLRLQGYLRRLAGGDAGLRTQPLIQVVEPAPAPPLVVGEPVLHGTGADASAASHAPGSITRTGDARNPIFAPGSMIAFSGDDVIAEESEDAIQVLGHVMVDVEPMGISGQARALQMRAERAVLFLKPGAMRGLRGSSIQVGADSVEGVYLEGDVSVTDFKYTIRGSRIYYDLAQNRALIADAVLRSSLRDGSPGVTRAKEMRQLSASEWSAEQLTLSSSDFAEPHLSIGASRAIITQSESVTGTTMLAEAEDVTLRAGGVPFFYWPKLQGEPGAFPLRRLRVGDQKYTGTQVSATLDPFVLLGLEAPDGWTASVPIDYYSLNGFGAGLNLAKTSGSKGNLSVYAWNDFQEQEQTYSGVLVTSPHELRGEIVGDWSATLGGGWRTQIQLGYLSDAAWTSTFRQRQYANRRSYETSLFLEDVWGNSSLQFLMNGAINDFVSTGWEMASRPYQVQKLPEAIFRSVGDTLWDDLTWTQEYQLAGIDMELQHASAQASGVRPQAISTSSSFSSTEDIAAAYGAAGYDEDWRARVMTRQEVSLPVQMGALRMAPFLFGVGAGYFGGEEFQAYGTQSGEGRLLAGGGVRASSRFSMTHDGVEIPVLDVHRLRHVFEPYSTLYAAWDSGSEYDYPVYDQEIEAISGNWATQFGLTQRLQTMRGAPGDWRNVDMVVLDTGIVLDGMDASGPRNDTDAGSDALQWRMSPAPAFYAWRPELSQRGSHGYLNGTYEFSDAVSFYGSLLYLFDDSNFPDADSLPRKSFGVSIRQRPDFTIFGEYRFIDAFNPGTPGTFTYGNDEFLSTGFAYEIGKNYDLGAALLWDVINNDFRGWNATLTREFPDLDFGVNAGYDEIQGEYTLSFMLRIGLPGKPRTGIRINPDPET